MRCNYCLIDSVNTTPFLGGFKICTECYDDFYNNTRCFNCFNDHSDEINTNECSECGLILCDNCNKQFSILFSDCYHEIDRNRCTD